MFLIRYMSLGEGEVLKLNQLYFQAGSWRHVFLGGVCFMKMCEQNFCTKDVWIFLLCSGFLWLTMCGWHKRKEMCWRTAIKAAFTPDAMTHFSSPIFISNICGSSEISPGFLPGGREISPDQKHSSTKIKVCHFKKDKKMKLFRSNIVWVIVIQLSYLGPSCFVKWVHCVNLFVPWLIQSDCTAHRDLSANETYMALPLMLAGYLWEPSKLTILNIYKFAQCFANIIVWSTNST